MKLSIINQWSNSKRPPGVRALPLILAITSMLLTTTVSVAAPQSPDLIVRAAVEDFVSEIQSHRNELKEHPDMFSDYIEKRLGSHFDFDRIGYLVLGRFGRDATHEQMGRFTQAFRHTLLNTYSNALLTYEQEKFEWTPLNLSPEESEAIVKVNILRDGGPSYPITLKMTLSGEEWKVYDITIDSISLITTYRGSFTPILRKKGLDALIMRLEEVRSR